MNTGERERSYPEPTPAAAGLREAAYPPSRIESDEPSEEMVAIYRAMTPQRRLELAEQIFWEVRRRRLWELQREHPDWPAEPAEHELRRIMFDEVMTKAT